MELQVLIIFEWNLLLFLMAKNNHKFVRRYSFGIPYPFILMIPLIDWQKKSTISSSTGVTERTTTESVTSRLRHHKAKAVGRSALFNSDEEISEIFMIPDRLPFEVPAVEHPKVRIHSEDP